jgi:hypothetical protein
VEWLVTVPAEEVGLSLTPREDSLFGLPNGEKPARNVFAEGDRFIHHLLWQHHHSPICPFFNMLHSYLLLIASINISSAKVATTL